MKCPACSHNMTTKKVAGVEVDVCQNGCGGIWFDRFELKKFDEKHESEGQELLDIPRNPNARVNPEQRPCPKCQGVTMQRFFASPRRRVEIDQCGMCSGLFLDANELHLIREEYKDEAERNAAGEKLFAETFGKEIDRLRAESSAKLENARKVAGMLRWICPTAWIPGKQKWGAW